MTLNDEDRQALDDLLVELMRSGRAFDAVREYRSEIGCGLREAALHVTRLGNERGIQLPPALSAS